MAKPHNYPHIYKFRDKEIKEILPLIENQNIDFVIQEKIDGSFFWVDYNAETQKIRYGSRKRELTDNVDADMFNQAVRVVKDIIAPKLKEQTQNVSLFCEYVKAKKHNILKYDRTPKNCLVLFDVFYDGKPFHLKDLKKTADLLEIESVPVLYVGREYNDKLKKKLLNTDSILGGTKIEGFVMKSNSSVLKHNSTLLIKVVSDRFKEVKTEPKKKKTGKDKLLDCMEKYRTKARWNKAIQHLSETQQLSNTAEDIGKLIKEIQQDIIKEEKENIKEELYELFIKSIIKHATQGFADYYLQLLEQQVKKRHA